MKKTMKRMLAMCLAVMLVAAVLVLPASASRTAHGNIGNARCYASVTASETSATATTMCDEMAHLTVRVQCFYRINYSVVKKAENNFENYSTEVSVTAFPRSDDTGVVMLKGEGIHGVYLTGFSNSWEAKTQHEINS